MGRRTGLFSALISVHNAGVRAHNANVRAQIRAQQQAIRAQRQAERESLAQERADERSARTQERTARMQEHEDGEERAESLNQELARRCADLHGLLLNSLGRKHAIDLASLKKNHDVSAFDPGLLGIPLPEPKLEGFMPPKPGRLSLLVPGAKARHEQARADAARLHTEALATHRANESARLQKVSRAEAEHAARIRKRQEEVAAQNAEIDRLAEQLGSGEPEAVVAYFTLVLQRRESPEDFPEQAKLAYVRESRQLAIEHDLPTFDVVPEVASHRYVRAKKQVVESVRPAKERRALYSLVIAQTLLRTLHEIFSADTRGLVDTIVFNGHVEAIDRGKGHLVRPCVVTVRTTREAFTALHLKDVDPVACLKVLRAAVSPSPEELLPVRPVLEFDMVDPRFIKEADVLSSLDQRPNLMALTFGEFESLITNLFSKMGLETRLTQASRDGGVDCVAYDLRPIFGGKVVIQAKRYKHTVGVSAVRDLYGTLQNEGASKGILVTTSGYGKASFEFAENKPIELLSGSNLLYLLATHVGVEAKIEPPDDWKDPEPDSEKGDV
jgi:restriction system protein